jgi:hypothetical protein
MILVRTNRYFKGRDITLTKDNLAKPNWQGSVLYSFCHKERQFSICSLIAILLIQSRVSFK